MAGGSEVHLALQSSWAALPSQTRTLGWLLGLSIGGLAPATLGLPWGLITVAFPGLS